MHQAKENKQKPDCNLYEIDQRFPQKILVRQHYSRQYSNQDFINLYKVGQEWLDSWCIRAQVNFLIYKCNHGASRGKLRT
jgi:hypothetical protein